jgi:hypothetical protein
MRGREGRPFFRRVLSAWFVVQWTVVAFMVYILTMYELEGMPFTLQAIVLVAFPAIWIIFVRYVLGLLRSYRIGHTDLPRDKVCDVIDEYFEAVDIEVVKRDQGIKTSYETLLINNDVKLWVFEGRQRTRVRVEGPRDGWSDELEYLLYGLDWSLRKAEGADD